VEDVLHALPPTDLDRSGGYVERYGIKPRFGQTEADATRTGADVEDAAGRTSDRPRVAVVPVRDVVRAVDLHVTVVALIGDDSGQSGKLVE
jgi:hypothetical protein